MPKIEDFLTPEEQESVIGAIRMAERNTSGEIRIHLEPHSTPPDWKNNEHKDAIERAEEVFNILHMQNTKESNGVLIYVAVEDRTLVIMDDKDINDKVGQNFWESTKDIMIAHFKKGEIKLGLVNGILKAGEQLKKYFPYQSNDENELPDDISVGKIS